MKKLIYLGIILLMIPYITAIKPSFSDDTIIVAQGNIHSSLATDTHLFYTIRDPSTKMFSLHTYNVDNGEDSVLVRDKKIINLFTYNQNSIYANKNFVIWMENGLWGWIPEKNATLISTIPFNNGIGVTNDSVAFSDNWSHKPGIYIQRVVSPYEKERIFDFKYKHQPSSLKTSDNYVVWVDTTKYITDNPITSSLVHYGDIKLYEVSTKKI